MYLCHELRNEIKKEDTIFRTAITVEKRVAITLWRLSTDGDYRTIGHLLGVAKGTVCVIVHEVCEAIVQVLFKKIHQITKWKSASSNHTRV